MASVSYLALYFLTATLVLAGPKRRGLYRQAHSFVCSGQSHLVDVAAHLDCNVFQNYGKLSHPQCSLQAANDGVQKASNLQTFQKESAVLPGQASVDKLAV